MHFRVVWFHRSYFKNKLRWHEAINQTNSRYSSLITKIKQSALMELFLTDLTHYCRMRLVSYWMKPKLLYIIASFTDCIILPYSIVTFQIDCMKQILNAVCDAESIPVVVKFLGSLHRSLSDKFQGTSCVQQHQGTFEGPLDCSCIMQIKTCLVLPGYRGPRKINIV